MLQSSLQSRDAEQVKLRLAETKRFAHELQMFVVEDSEKLLSSTIKEIQNNVVSHLESIDLLN